MDWVDECVFVLFMRDVNRGPHFEVYLLIVRFVKCGASTHGFLLLPAFTSLSECYGGPAWRKKS